MAKKLILIVEDEKDLVKALDYNIKHEGYETLIAYTGGQALKHLSSDPKPDLVLLDLMLPDMSGIDVCRHLRQTQSINNIPVIILTAKGEEADRVKGLEAGADDYVVKPFSVRELILRIHAVFRRSRKSAVDTKEFLFGCLRVDVPAHRVWVNEQELKLTALEFKLLMTLISRRGRVQTRDTLLTDVWGIQANVITRTVDTHIKRLREKLGQAGDYIETLRGVGYRFLTEESQGLNGE